MTTSTIPKSEAPRHLTSYSGRQYLGAGIIGTGVYGIKILSRQPWFDGSALPVPTLCKMQRRGNFLYVGLGTTIAFGAEMIFMEHFKKTSAKARSQPVDAVAPMVAIGPTTKWQQAVYATPFSVFFGVSLLAVYQAAQVGVLSKSTFRASPFWAGKMMVPLWLGEQISRLFRCGLRVADLVTVSQSLMGDTKSGAALMERLDSLL